MKSIGLRRKGYGRAALVMSALAISAAGVGGMRSAQAAEPSRLPESLSGLLNDYTPPAPTVAGGPYEMHGKWSLHLGDGRRPATFTAEMTMQTADFANTDPNHDPTKLGAHTHHISVADGVVHNDPTDPINWQTQCPVFKPAVTGGFVVTGTAYVTGNGGNPPFGNPSPVTICVLGGMQNTSLTTAQAFVEFSNFTLTFAAGSHASTHFGVQAINGVVAACERPWKGESSDCKVETVD
jgi:hypothetical protein